MGGHGYFFKEEKPVRGCDPRGEEKIGDWKGLECKQELGSSFILNNCV